MKEIAERALPDGASSAEDFEVLVGAFGAESRTPDVLDTLAALTKPSDKKLRKAIRRVSRFAEQVRDTGIAIDFVLGAKELKEIPERGGYSRVLLGLELPTGERITLARSVDGGSISLYRSDIRVEPSTPADETLAAKHSAASTKNISRFLLDQVDLDEKQVRKNARNDTHMLSFRDLTRLCLIGETEMQAEEAPGLSGNPVNKTKEVSALKLLLAGEDDSALTAVPSPHEQKRLRGARRTVREYARFSTPPLRSPSPNIAMTGKCHTLDSSCSTRPSSPTDHRISPQRRTTSHRRALSGPSTVTSRPTLTVRSSSWRTPIHWTRSETTRATSASRSTSTREGTASCLSSKARGLPTP